VSVTVWLTLHCEQCGYLVGEVTADEGGLHGRLVYKLKVPRSFRSEERSLRRKHHAFQGWFGVTDLDLDGITGTQKVGCVRHGNVDADLALLKSVALSAMANGKPVRKGVREVAVIRR
jgi:hypothetical protein